MNINTGTLIGRVGGEPEVKHFESGTVVAKFTLAVNRRSKKDDQPDWFNCEAWGKTAEVIEKYVSKGKQLAIRGSLKIETWQDKKTGETQSKPVVRVDEVELLGSKNDTNAAPEE
jgi:single-strand DNA-binding protein